MPRGGSRKNAGRKSGWSNSETQVIRVPKALADKLLEIARKLDSGEDLEFVTKSKNTLSFVEEKSSVFVTDSKKDDSSQLNLLDISGKQPPADLSARSCEEFSLPVSDLARRWGQKTPAISRAKKEKTPEEFIEYTRKKEPKGFGWEHLPGINRFRPVGISPEDLQELKDLYRVNPSPVGSERSEEG